MVVDHYLFEVKMKSLLLIPFVIICSCGTAVDVKDEVAQSRDVQEADVQRILEESILQTEFLEPDVTQDVDSD
jgi:hypothetical protein